MNAISPISPKERNSKVSIKNLLLNLNNQPLFVSSLLSGLLLCTIIFALSQGAYTIPFNEVINSIFTSSASQSEGSELAAYLLLNIRLPRIILGCWVGAALSVSGSAIQGLFRNPLAEPSLIGITSGGMLFAVAGIFFANTILVGLSAYFGHLTITVLSFTGSFLTTVLIYKLATYRGKTYVTTMLLGGIAITALCGAFSGLMIYFSDEAQLRDITFWTLGSLSSGSWKTIAYLVPITSIAIFFLIRTARALDLFILGEHEAAYLGINVQMVKWTILFFSALAVGTCVATTGTIGFIALVVPHTLRLLTGTKHRPLLINSALLGAILLVLADTFARTVIAPAELPIGVITALVGAPFFIWMLVRVKRKNNLFIS